MGQYANLSSRLTTELRERHAALYNMAWTAREMGRVPGLGDNE